MTKHLQFATGKHFSFPLIWAHVQFLQWSTHGKGSGCGIWKWFQAPSMFLATLTCLYRHTDLDWTFFTLAEKRICQFISCMVLGLKQPIALGISYHGFVQGLSQHRKWEPQQILLCWQKVHVSTYIFFKNSWNSKTSHLAFSLAFGC